MRYRGGGVGHRSIHEATQCLLNDHDKLNTQLFTLEYCESSTEDGEDGGDSDIPMDNSSDPEEGGTSDEDGSEMDGINLRHTQQLVDDELGDEMDKYGYTGLDQLLDRVEEDAETCSDDGTLALEGRFPDDELEYADL